LSEQSRGKIADDVLWEPRRRYLLDPSLNPGLAAGLRTARWDILAVHELFEVAPSERIVDEQIIPRCREEGRVWVTADDAARRRHAEQLGIHDIHVLWVKRRDGRMGSPHQLALLSHAILRLDQLLEIRADRHRHFEVGWALGHSPKPLDRRRVR
jgi:hypothetical protein